MSGSANAVLRHKLMGFIVTQAIRAVVEAGVIDKLAIGPATGTELTEACGTDHDALIRFMGVLVAEGLVTEDAGNQYALTELGSLLREDVPGSLRTFASMMVGEAYLAWQAAGHALRTGKPAFSEVFGEPLFSWLANHSDAQAAFDAAQAGLVRSRAEPLFTLDWPDDKTVIDVGGGNGRLMAELLTDQPRLRGIVFDLPHVVAKARTVLVEAGVADRCECVGGDFFTVVPANADFYVLAEILHDWNNHKATTLLQRCHAAMPSSARLLIVEQIALPDRPPWLDLLDLHMLVMVGGRERDEQAWHSLLDSANFTITAVQATERSSLIEARPR